MAFKGVVCGAAVAMLLPAATSSDLITCHTAVEGEECKDLVDWAMSEGIYAHPEWYPDLTPQSSFKEFQMAIFDSRRQSPEGLVCSPPCEGDDTCCCVAANGTECHGHIMWAMTDGIFGAPQDYEGSGLTTDSSYVEFQSFLAAPQSSAWSNCTMPCSGAGDGQNDNATDASDATTSPTRTDENDDAADANDRTPPPTPGEDAPISSAAAPLPLAAASALVLQALLDA